MHISNSGGQESTDRLLTFYYPLLAVSAVMLPVGYLAYVWFDGQQAGVFLDYLIALVVAILAMRFSITGQKAAQGWLAGIANLLIPLLLTIAAATRKVPEADFHAWALFVMCGVAWLPSLLVQETVGGALKRLEQPTLPAKGETGPAKPSSSRILLVIWTLLCAFLFVSLESASRARGSDVPSPIPFALLFYLNVWALFSLGKLVQQMYASAARPVVVSQQVPARWAGMMVLLLVSAMVVAALLPKQPIQKLNTAYENWQRQHRLQAIERPGVRQPSQPTTSSPRVRRTAPREAPSSPRQPEPAPRPERNPRPEPPAQQQPSPGTGEGPSSTAPGNQPSTHPRSGDAPTSSTPGKDVTQRPDSAPGGKSDAPSSKSQPSSGKPGSMPGSDAAKPGSGGQPSGASPGSDTGSSPGGGKPDAGGGTPSPAPGSGAGGAPSGAGDGQSGQGQQDSTGDQPAPGPSATPGGEGGGSSQPEGGGQPSAGNAPSEDGQPSGAGPQAAEGGDAAQTQAEQQRPLDKQWWVWLLMALGLLALLFLAMVLVKKYLWRKVPEPIRRPLERLSGKVAQRMPGWREREIARLIAEKDPFENPFANPGARTAMALMRDAYATFTAYLWLLGLERKANQTEFGFALWLGESTGVNGKAALAITQGYTHTMYAEVEPSPAECAKVQEALERIIVETTARLDPEAMAKKQQQYRHQQATAVFDALHTKTPPAPSAPADSTGELESSPSR